MGHLDHGLSLALPNQVERYGFLTISGSTGGFRLDAAADETSDATVAARTESFIFCNSRVGYIQNKDNRIQEKQSS